MVETKKSFRKQRSRSDVDTSDVSLGVVSKLGFNVISFIMCYPISSLTNDCVNLMFVKTFGRSLRDILSTWLFKLLWYFPWSVTDQMNTSINLLGFLPEVLLSLVLKDLVLIYFNFYPVIDDPHNYSHDRVQSSTTKSKGHSRRRKRDLLHRHFMLSSDECDSPPLQRDYYSNSRQHDKHQRIPVDAFFFFRLCWRLVTSFIQLIVTGISKPLPKQNPNSSLSDPSEDLPRSHHRHTRGRRRVNNHHKVKGHRQRHIVETAATTSSNEDEIAPPSRYLAPDNIYLSDEIVMTSSSEESAISEDEKEPPLRLNKKTRARRQHHYDNHHQVSPNADVTPAASSRRKMINKQQQTVNNNDEDEYRLQQIYQKIKVQNKKKRKVVEKNLFRKPHVVHSSGDGVAIVGKPPSARSEEYASKSKSPPGVPVHTKPVHSRPSDMEHRNSNLDRTSYRSHRSSQLDHRPSNLDRDSNMDHRSSNLDRRHNMDHRSSNLDRRSDMDHRLSNLDNRPSNLERTLNVDHRPSNLERSVGHRSSNLDNSPPNLDTTTNTDHRTSNPQDKASTVHHSSSNLDRTGMGQGDYNRKSPNMEIDNSTYLIERESCNISPPVHHRNHSEVGEIEKSHTSRDPSFRIPHNNSRDPPVIDWNDSDTNLEDDTSDEDIFDKTAQCEASALATKYLRRSRKKRN